jgi:hypothetical protein
MKNQGVFMSVLTLAAIALLMRLTGCYLIEPENAATSSMTTNRLIQIFAVRGRPPDVGAQASKHLTHLHANWWGFGLDKTGEIVHLVGRLAWLKI